MDIDKDASFSNDILGMHTTAISNFGHKLELQAICGRSGLHNNCCNTAGVCKSPAVYSPRKCHAGFWTRASISCSRAILHATYAQILRIQCPGEAPVMGAKSGCWALRPPWATEVDGTYTQDQQASTAQDPSLQTVKTAARPLGANGEPAQPALPRTGSPAM